MIDDEIREVAERIANKLFEDVVEVVRCKDCKHWIPNIPKYAHIGYKVCNHEYNDGLCEGIGYEWEEDDFCSRGEKR